MAAPVFVIAPVPEIVPVNKRSVLLFTVKIADPRVMSPPIPESPPIVLLKFAKVRFDELLVKDIMELGEKALIAPAFNVPVDISVVPEYVLEDPLNVRLFAPLVILTFPRGPLMAPE